MVLLYHSTYKTIINYPVQLINVINTKLIRRLELADVTVMQKKSHLKIRWLNRMS